MMQDLTREQVIAELNGALPANGSLEGSTAVSLATIKRAAELMGADIARS
jgi:shikimate kinase